ncbi:MAG: hypothetical protein R3C32_02100 [Chloroflexota bacterium]
MTSTVLSARSASGCGRVPSPASTGRHGSAAYRSRWCSTTPMTASCARSSRGQLRLGLTRFDLAVIHDLDHIYHGSGPRYEGFLAQLATSGWRAIGQLRDAGLIRATAGIKELGLFRASWEIAPSTPSHRHALHPCSTRGARRGVLACVAQGVGFIIGAPHQ